MTLIDAIPGQVYIIKSIQTEDEELDSFLFTLGCYSGEPITVISRLKGGLIVAIKDGRYNIDKPLAEAIEAISRLPRVSALVLAGSLMGGEITESVKKVKEESNLIVISLNMPGSVTEYADLIITDPIQAGVLAVMAIADTAVFNIERLGDNIKF